MSKVVWCNGCYDLLHPGHISLFAAAKSLAGTEGRLIVGLDSDAKIARDKGPSRPINTFADRKALLEAIKYIDLVLGFDTREELEELIQFYRPDILVDGGDWRDHDGVGREFAKETRFFNRVGGYSSSEIIRRCRDVCE
jgi:D-beta-D-heptose 7-phosphate kinase/D-beta-D-heptose 1-phosphate adenosyltransferase